MSRFHDYKMKPASIPCALSLQTLIGFCLLLFLNFGLYGEPNSFVNTQKICETPFSDSYWHSISSKDAGFDSELLCTLLQRSHLEIEDLHSLLIIKNGKLVTESYYQGEDKPFNKRYGLRLPFDGKTLFYANTLHDVRSVSKSVTSLLYGIALDKKMIPRPESSVFEYFPEVSIPKMDPRSEITWLHILTMSSGLNWREWGYGFLLSHETSLLWKKDITSYVLDRELIMKPGERFNYNGGGTALIGELLTRSTGKSIQTLANEWLFQPLGIQEFEWVEDFHGRSLSHAGLRLRPRDMAKIGKLVLNGGTWEGTQIISKKWIDDSLKTQIRTGVTFFRKDGSELGYGFHFWTGESTIGIKKITWKAALGNGGQMIYILPEEDMIVITTAGGYGDPKAILQTSAFLDEILRTLK